LVCRTTWRRVFSVDRLLRTLDFVRRIKKPSEKPSVYKKTDKVERMKEARNKEKNILQKTRPFTKDQEKELQEKPLREIRNILKALDTWRKESLTSSMRF